MPYASILNRFIAAFIDGIIVAVALTIILKIISLIVIPSMALVYIVWILVVWAYFAYLESSPKQATIGKIIMKMKVIDEQGNRLTQKQAAIRSGMRLVSGFIFCIGFIMALFNDKKQTLHDQVAHTYVVNGVAGQAAE